MGLKVTMPVEEWSRMKKALGEQYHPDQNDIAYWRARAEKAEALYEAHVKALTDLLDWVNEYRSTGKSPTWDSIWPAEELLKKNA